MDESESLRSVNVESVPMGTDPDDSDSALTPAQVHFFGFSTPSLGPSRNERDMAERMHVAEALAAQVPHSRMPS